jgi:hypothetical protein
MGSSENEQTNEILESIPQGINRALPKRDGRVGEEPGSSQRGLEASVRDA